MVARARLAQPVHVTVAGQAASLGIDETPPVLHRERVLWPLDAALARIGGEAAEGPAGAPG